ncbi:MAG: c-type cytochrome [Alphaproteobacteria bacterium]
MRQALKKWLLLSSALIVASIGMTHAAATLGQKRQAELTNLVRQDCGSCHGMTLKGGLGGPLLPESLAGADNESIASIILHGVPGKPMPPWTGLLTREEAIWIASKLKEGFPQ